jgi:hypothetical protein
MGHDDDRVRVFKAAGDAARTLAAGGNDPGAAVRLSEMVIYPEKT